jgi:hypothetical protein
VTPPQDKGLGNRIRPSARKISDEEILQIHEDLCAEGIRPTAARAYRRLYPPESGCKPKITYRQFCKRYLALGLKKKRNLIEGPQTRP